MPNQPSAFRERAFHRRSRGVGTRLPHYLPSVHWHVVVTIAWRQDRESLRYPTCGSRLILQATRVSLAGVRTAIRQISAGVTRTPRRLSLSPRRFGVVRLDFLKPTIRENVPMSSFLGCRANYVSPPGTRSLDASTLGGCDGASCIAPAAGGTSMSCFRLLKPAPASIPRTSCRTVHLDRGERVHAAGRLPDSYIGKADRVLRAVSQTGRRIRQEQ